MRAIHNYQYEIQIRPFFPTGTNRILKNLQIKLIGGQEVDAYKWKGMCRLLTEQEVADVAP